MVIFVMLKLYKLLHYKEIPPIYWMTLVLLETLSNTSESGKNNTIFH